KMVPGGAPRRPSRRLPQLCAAAVQRPQRLPLSRLLGADRPSLGAALRIVRSSVHLEGRGFMDAFPPLPTLSRTAARLQSGLDALSLHSTASACDLCAEISARLRPRDTACGPDDPRLA